MNEKSKAFELIEFVWNNEKTDSYLRVNIAMYEAVKLAIISQMKFNKEDFQNIFSKFSGGYWFGVNANGKGYGENFYRKAVTSGNISACQSYEAFCNIKPFLVGVKVSYVLFVTQPTKLSNQDVLRTMDFFHERCGKVNCGIVENMCYGTEHNEYPIRLVAQIPMQDNMNTENLLTNAYNEFQKIVDEIVQSDIVVLEEYSTENGYDENFDVTDIHITGSRKHYFTHELKYDNGVEKTLTLPAMKFLSVRTWDKIRDYIRFHDDLGHLWDERMRRCDTERVGRVVNHFQNDDNAYFMVINAPNTEVHLITGEIGICSLLTGQRGHFELPRVSYQTSKGNVVLFPDEIMPVDINLLQQEINEGYIMLSDGRYLPPKEAVQQCYNAFGIRVGLGDNWEDIYDGWNKEMK